jgi:tetratricopeptide (TPR) repeat protein
MGMEKLLFVCISVATLFFMAGCSNSESAAFLSKGNEALEEEKYELAKEMYNSVLEITPDNKEAVEGLQKVEKRLKEKALSEVWEQNVEKAKNLLAEQSYDKLFDYTTEELKKISNEDSLSTYRKELERLKSMAIDIVPTYLKKAKEVTESGKHEEALNYIKIAEHIKGETNETKKWKTINQQFIKAKEHVDKKEYPEAKSILQDILVMNTDSSEAQFLLDQIITWENNQPAVVQTTPDDPLPESYSETEQPVDQNPEDEFVQIIRTAYDNFYYDVIKFTKSNSNSIRISQLYSDLGELEYYFNEAHNMNPPNDRTTELKQAWINVLDSQAVFIDSMIQMEYESDPIGYHGEAVMPAMNTAMDAIEELERQLSMYP